MSTIIDGIEVINICDVLKVVHPNWLHDFSVSYAERSTRVAQWAEKHDAIVYSRDREDFSKYEAARLAREAGKSRVVVEDLS